MYRTILVPLDGSKRAERILNQVEDLALSNGARVIFLQVINPPHSVIVDGDYLDWQRQHLLQQTKLAELYLSGLKGEFREKGIKARTRVVNGSVVSAISSTAERDGADLIAIASHGRKGLSRAFFGSVTAGILNQIDQPLLIIRSNGDR